MVDRSEFLPQSGLRLASGRRRQAHDDAGHDEVGTYMLVVLVISRQQDQGVALIRACLVVLLSCCLVVLLSCCLVVLLSCCLVVFLYFCIFVFNQY